jgi:hypothetical protein
MRRILRFIDQDMADAGKTQGRKAMKGTIFAAMALIAAAATVSTGQTPEAKPVHGQGCVEAGVEARCLVVKDVKSGILYNLLIKGTRPDIGIGIDFTGVPFDGMSYCMQGVVLEVSNWTPDTSLKCAPVQTPKP